MSKPRVFVSRIIPDAGMERIQATADAEIWPGDVPPPYEVLLEKVKGIDGLVCLLTDQIDGNLMDTAGEALKVISQMAVGFDNIDVTAATERGIPVGHTPGVLTDTTADFAFTLLMTAARRVVEGVDYVKAGKWKTWGPTLLMGQDIYGATLGIVGLGRIGQGMAERASGFKMKIKYFDDFVDPGIAKELGAEPASIEEIFETADFVSLHVPLTPDTEHMISKSQLKAMKPSAILINTSRGPVVDPEALYEALKSGDIAYAALDVTEPEPIPADDPLLSLDNCIVVPHIASSSRATRNKMATMTAANLEAGLKGDPLPNLVNPEVNR
jgi:glyoxylate reductase